MKGGFSSPGYPRNYCDKMSCKYTFQAPPGKIVKLEFNEVRLEDKDFLKAYNTLQGSDKILQTLVRRDSHPIL